MSTPETGSSSIVKTSFSENDPTSTAPLTPEKSIRASREISKPNVSGGRALLGALFTGLSNIATLPVNIASFILGGAAGKACGKTQEGREGATLALGLTIGLPFTLAGLGLSLIATALKNSEKPNFQDTFKDAFMNSNLLNFSSRLHEAADKEMTPPSVQNQKTQGEAELEARKAFKEYLEAQEATREPKREARKKAILEIKTPEEAIQWIKGEGPNNHMALLQLKDLDRDMGWNKEVVLVAVGLASENFEYASENLKDDFDIAKLAVSKNANLLRKLGPTQKQNDEILKIALSKNGWLLEVVAPENQTEELIKIALQQDYQAAQYIAESVKTKELMEALFEVNPIVIGYTPSAFITEEMAEKAVKKGGYFLRNIPKDMITKELALTAITNKPLALEYVPDHLKAAKVKVGEELEEKTLEQIACNQNPFALNYASDDFKNNREAVTKLVLIEPKVFKYVSDNLKQDNFLEEVDAIKKAKEAEKTDNVTEPPKTSWFRSLFKRS